MRLADLGLLQKAYDYVRSAQAEVKKHENRTPLRMGCSTLLPRCQYVYTFDVVAFCMFCSPAVSFPIEVKNLKRSLAHSHFFSRQVAAMSGRSQGGSEQRSPYSPQFITALNEFEDRTCAALGLEATAPGSTPSGAADGGKKERSTGSAAAGAGGWLINRCFFFVSFSVSCLRCGTIVL